MKLLIVDDDEAVLFGYRRSLTKEGYAVMTATCLNGAKSLVGENRYDAMLLDLKLPDGNALEWLPELKAQFPDLPVIVATGEGDVTVAVKAMQSGAENYLIKPVDTKAVEAALKMALELGGLRRQDRVQRRLRRKSDPFFGTGASAATLMRQLDLAASSDTVLLLQGETGTGKGVVARWVHENSSRSTGPFVELNCSCLKGDLLRSELYGHTKGSFTSAVTDRDGLVEIANDGTLFLDEIGDMDLAVQAQLLKTIEERTFRKVGENRLRTSDFRLVCATNKDLLRETENGTFRKDLYYRICVFPVTLPALRERSRDLVEMSKHILADLGSPGAAVPPEVAEALCAYHWPGNIRELRNTLERAVLIARGQTLTPECFPGFEPVTPPILTESDTSEGLHELENGYLRKVVESCKGDKKKACEILGISLATIYRKLGPAASAGHSPAS